MSCDDLRPRLGEFLTGALDEPTGQRVADHLTECEACARELAGLHTLEERLGALPAAPAAPAPVTPRSSPWLLRLGLLATAAVALLAGLIAFSTPDSPRLLYGAVSYPSVYHEQTLVVSAGEPIPSGHRLFVDEAAVLELPGRSLVEAEPGCELVLSGPSALRQTDGRAFFRVAGASTHQPFVVHTPRGTVRVPGTSFRVEVRRDPMKLNATQASAAAAVVAVAVISGVVMFDHEDGSAEVRAGHELVADESGVTVSPIQAAEPPPEAPAADGELKRLSEEKAALEREKAELAAERAKLATELEEARAEVEALRAKVTAAPEPEPSPRPRKIPVAFGEHVKVEPLQNTNWEEMAQAVDTMIELLTPETVSALRSGNFKKLPPEVLGKISANNGKLVQLAISISDRVPSHGPTANGEYTHPIVLANLTAEHLRLVGQPLSEAQLQELQRLGREYDDAWERKQTRYTEETPLLEKMLDELELKRTFVDAMQAELTELQRKVVIREETHHVSGLDLYSPVLMLSGLARTVSADTAEALHAKLVDRAVGAWGFKKEELANAGPVFDGWIRALGREIPPAPTDLYTLDQALVSGRAQLGAMKELLRWTQEGDAAHEKLLESPALFIPGVKPPAPLAPAGD